MCYIKMSMSEKKINSMFWKERPCLSIPGTLAKAVSTLVVPIIMATGYILSFLVYLQVQSHTWYQLLGIPYYYYILSCPVVPYSIPLPLFLSLIYRSRCDAILSILEVPVVSPSHQLLRTFQGQGSSRSIASVTEIPAPSLAVVRARSRKERWRLVLRSLAGLFEFFWYATAWHFLSLLWLLGITQLATTMTILHYDAKSYHLDAKNVSHESVAPENSIVSVTCPEMSNGWLVTCWSLITQGLVLAKEGRTQGGKRQQHEDHSIRRNCQKHDQWKESDTVFWGPHWLRYILKMSRRGNGLPYVSGASWYQIRFTGGGGIIHFEIITHKEVGKNNEKESLFFESVFSAFSKADDRGSKI